MTTMTFSSSPASTGGFIADLLGRFGIWALTKTISAPISAALLAVMVVGSGMAASNALYAQVIQHPAPMFTDETITAAVSPVETLVETPRQILPIVKPEPVALPVVEATVPAVAPLTVTAPVPAVPKAVASITNADIKALQQKLTSLGFYQGDADGFYGPKTAEAIRAFERGLGINPVGAVTPEVLKAAAGTPKPTAAAPMVTAPVTLPQAVVKQAENTVADTVQPIVEKLAQATEKSLVPPTTVDSPIAKIVQQVATVTANNRFTPTPSQDRRLIENVQRGLASLGFLRGKIDGVAGEETAKAIRNFEVYYNYDVTGAVSPELIDLLINAGAEV